MSIAQIAADIKNGKVDLLAYLNGVCDRIEKDDPLIQAMVPGTYDRDRILGEASLLLDRFPDPADRPPLFGVPIGVKDIINVSDFPTRCGSRLPLSVFDGPEADCVSRLRSAGTIIMGKTVTTEFAYFDPGPTRNPYNPKHTPGGSSSGSAAGVACGFFLFGLGSQTGGSTIRPAAYCGVVGFKPSFGRIPMKGVMSLSETLDHLGILCGDISGIDPIMQIIDGDWKPRAAKKPVEDLLLGVPDGPYIKLATAHGVQYFETTVEKLKKNGCEIKRIKTLSDIDIINDNHLRLMNAEIARSHGAWYSQYRELYGVKMSEAIEQGATVSDDEIRKLRAETVKFRKRMEQEMQSEGIDAWICPPTLDSAPEGLSSTGSPIMNFPWTQAGLPSLCLPCGKDETGLPQGLQIVGFFMRDEELIASMHDLYGILNEGWVIAEE